MEFDIVSSLPAQFGILFQASPDQAIECRRRQRLYPQDWLRFRVEDGGNNAGRRATAEGALAGKHLVEDGAEGKDIAAHVGFFSLELLRRHVLKRSEQRAPSRQRGCLRCFSDGLTV